MTVLESLFHQYAESLRARSIVESSIERKRGQIERFVEWLKRRGVAEPSKVTRRMLNDYQCRMYSRREIKDEQPTPASKSYQFSAVRMWFEWMTREKHIARNPFLEKAQPQEPLSNVLTEQEAELVLHQPNINTPLGLRDRALMETLYATGIRPTEVTRLWLEDVDFEGGTVLIRRDDGKKDRVVPLGRRAAEWLERYIRDARPQLVSEPEGHAVFLTSTGRVIDRGQIIKHVHDYVKQSRVGKKGTALMFRQSMAALMFANGADIRSIQQMLGYVSRISWNHSFVTLEQLQKIHEATHPGERMEALHESDS
jgi:integrase/recombinase XerD